MARLLAGLLAAVALVACGGGSDDDPSAPQDPPPATVQGDPDAAAPPPEAPPPVTKPAPKTSIAVKGNTLVGADGQPVRLLGVNYSGGEYMCIQGRGIFDGPSDTASLVDAIVSWKANVVRVALNEHCWLGLAGVDPRYSGKPYRDAIGALIDQLRAKDLYVILEVHWSSAIPGQAVKQQPMLDRDNGLPFWHSVADAYKGDPGILFDVYNEPFLDVTNTNHAYADDPWSCWRLGCEVHFEDQTYVSAGVQPVIAEIRAAGATNVVLLGGLDYANDTRGMPGHWPSDPASQAAASVHVYADKRCNTESCWTSEIDGIASFVPVVAGELGQTDCGRDFVDGYMAWADPRGLGYLGWAFNVADCSSRPALISDWSGTPTPFGAAFKERFAALAN